MCKHELYHKANDFKVTDKLDDSIVAMSIGLVSPMCDNKSWLTLDRRDGVTTISLRNNSCRLSFSNLSLKEDNGIEMINWAFYENNIDEIMRILSTGINRVYEVKVMRSKNA